MTSQAGKMNDRGTTLIELCLVCVILSFLFSISWPLLNSLSRRKNMEMTINEMSATLRAARDFSMAECKYHCVQFDRASGQYWISVRESGHPGEYFIPLSGSLQKRRYWPDTIQAENISGEKVIFYPDGTSSDFEISLKDNFKNTMTLKLQGSTGVIIIIPG